MKKRIEFFLAMIPPTKTHQQKKIRIQNGKPMTYEPVELKTLRSKLMGLLVKYRPEAPLVGPIQLVTKWIYPARGKHASGEYKTTKPDTDNMIKLLKDCMTDCGYWKDDAHVASEVTEKFYGEVTGIYVCAAELCRQSQDNCR